MNTVKLAAAIVAFAFFSGLIPADIAPAYDEHVYQYQKRLRDMGYDPGPLDGIWGKKTDQAFRAYQRDIKHNPDIESPPSQASLREALEKEPSGWSAGADADQKVGFINLKRLVNESRMGQAARNELQKIRQEKEALVGVELRKVNALRELIDKAGDKMSPQEKREKLLALQEVNKAYQRLVADVKEDILREDRELVRIILQKAEGVLKKVAKRLNYAVILKDAAAIGYVDPAVDITDEVIRELDRKR